MWFVIAMLLLATLSFFAMNGTKDRETQWYCCVVCIVACAAAALVFICKV